MLIIICCIYLLILAVFFVALLQPVSSSDSSYHWKASIIIAARNEEENIGHCLESLISIDYPSDLLEIIVVDDLSQDRTTTIVLEFAAHHPGIRLVSSTEDRNDHLVGKTRALSIGIAMAAGEFIFLTDADCQVPATWVSEMIKYYEDERVGMVAGFTSLSGGNLFGRIQALDWFTLFSFAAASARLGIPSTAVGNNLSLRRAAYDAVGGYGKIPFSVTEDLALVRAMTSATSYTLAFSKGKRSLVHSTPCRTWQEWYRQRTRWFLGGKALSAVSKLILLTGYAFNIVVIYLFVDGQSSLALTLLAGKILMETALVFPAVSRFSRISLLWILPFFQVYFFLYVCILPLFTVFRRSVLWKGRTVAASQSKKPS